VVETHGSKVWGRLTERRRNGEQPTLGPCWHVIVPSEAILALPAGMYSSSVMAARPVRKRSASCSRANLMQ
jgi:hypothetical protein